MTAYGTVKPVQGGERGLPPYALGQPHPASQSRKMPGSLAAVIVGKAEGSISGTLEPDEWAALLQSYLTSTRHRKVWHAPFWWPKCRLSTYMRMLKAC